MRSRLRILIKRGKYNKAIILGHTVLAFQIGVPAWGFSLKVKKQRNTLRSRLRILSKRGKKQRNNEPGAHHYDVPSWRSRLGILSKNMINSKKQIRRRKTSKTKNAPFCSHRRFFRKKRLWLQNGAFFVLLVLRLRICFLLFIIFLLRIPKRERQLGTS